MISKGNQYTGTRDLVIKKGVRLSRGDADRYAALAYELGLNDRRGAEGFAEFARLAIRFTADHVETLKLTGRRDWKEAALRDLGLDPDEVYPE